MRCFYQFSKRISCALHCRHPHRQRGAGFVELVVSLSILAIGLLGVLSMQSNGLGSNQRAIFASEVNMLAADMADRILSFGDAGAASGEFNGIDSDPDDPDNPPTFGNSVVQAHADSWIALVNASMLPGAVATVDWDEPTTAYTITVQWDDERTGITRQDCTDDTRDANEYRIFLTCFQLTVSL